MKTGKMKTAFVAALLVTGLATSAVAEPRTVAGLFYAKVTEGNWDPAGYQAFTAMVKKQGFKSSYAEEATYDKAPEILSDFAARGTDLIIAHSSGYASAVSISRQSFQRPPSLLFQHWPARTGCRTSTAGPLSGRNLAFSLERWPALRPKPTKSELSLAT